MHNDTGKILQLQCHHQDLVQGSITSYLSKAHVTRDSSGPAT